MFLLGGFEMKNTVDTHRFKRNVLQQPKSILKCVTYRDWDGVKAQYTTREIPSWVEWMLIMRE